MPADFAALQKEIQVLIAQVQATEGVEASAKKAIVSILANQAAAIQQAVVDALAGDQASIDAAVAAMGPVVDRFAASATDLATAIPAVP